MLNGYFFVYVVTVIEISSDDEEATPGKRQGSVHIENGKFIYSCASRV